MTKEQIVQSLDRFTRAYIDAFLWAENDESNESGGEHLDKNYSVKDFTAEALNQIVKDCKAFQRDNETNLLCAGSPEQNGHDFYLTRNRHGAGFWDRGYPAVLGKELTDAAHVYGTQGASVYRGKIYVHG